MPTILFLQISNSTDWLKRKLVTSLFNCSKMIQSCGLSNQHLNTRRNIFEYTQTITCHVCVCTFITFQKKKTANCWHVLVGYLFCCRLFFIIAFTKNRDQRHTLKTKVKSVLSKGSHRIFCIPDFLLCLLVVVVVVACLFMV